MAVTGRPGRYPVTPESLSSPRGLELPATYKPRSHLGRYLPSTLDPWPANLRQRGACQAHS